MKKFALLMLMAVLVLGLIASVVVAGGPANRATGSVWLDHGDAWNRYIEFDAHAARDGRLAKGIIYWYQWQGPQEWDETSPRHVVEVKYVKVEGDTAWFAAGPGSQGWLVMKVRDLGTPASDGDEVSAVWVTSEADAEAMVILGGDLTGNVYIYELIGGNLVVNYYE
jgi:hypothetical protein